MNEPWYWKLGFSENPFGIKPAALTSEVVGRHLEPILEKVENGAVQFIEAPLGSGKTTILKGIISRFGGRKKLIYCSCIMDEGLDVQGLLKNATIKGRIFGRIPEGMIFLVDEAQNISKADSQEITRFMESLNIKSVAFFGTNYDKSRFTEELNSSLNGNVTVLSALSPEESVELVRHRIGNLKLMPDYVIREIYKRSNGNPRRLLQNCEEACRKAEELSIKELAITDIAMLLRAPEIPFPRKKRQKKQLMAGERPEKAEKPKPAKHLLKRGWNRAKKESKKAEKAMDEISSTGSQTATVTYSGYNLKNIRSYEEEMGTVKQLPREELEEPEDD